MSLQPDTDQRLERSSRRLTANGVRLLALVVLLDVVGAILIITDASVVGGLFCLGLSMPLAIGTAMLMSSGAVAKRASQQKDFA